MRFDGDKGGRPPSAERARVADAHARVLSEWSKGKTDREIAAELGLSKGVVHGIVQRSRGPDAEKAKSDHKRNTAARGPAETRAHKDPDREARVLARWADGETAGQIGMALGVTRNTVIGVVHRAGKGRREKAPFRAGQRVRLKRPGGAQTIGAGSVSHAGPGESPGAIKVAEPARCSPPGKARGAEDRDVGAINAEAPHPLPAPLANSAPPAPRCDGVTIGELEPHHCRFPLGDVVARATLYCGASRGLRGPAFCDAHAARAYTAAGLRHYSRQQPQEGAHHHG
jgi:hypothetical protein